MRSIFGTTPDHRRLTAALQLSRADRVPVYEFFSDTEVQLAALKDWQAPSWLPSGSNQAMDHHIRAQYGLGYDYVSVTVELGFGNVPRHQMLDGYGTPRSYLVQEGAPILSREDLERYPWPEPKDLDFSNLDYLSSHLPEGMKVVVNLGGGLLEWAMWLMGSEALCLTLYDDPSLLRDLCARINAQQLSAASQAASHPEVCSVALGDDMGFKTQTFLPPAALREFIFPGLRKVADAVHLHGRPFILHACGNLTEVMDDLIERVRIDAKHSFEDAIMPVTEVKRRWGDRVALLGGVDIDKLCRLEEGRLRSYVRGILESCGQSGGFALGSGNSIPNYIPPQSLRIMLDEAIRCQIAA